MITEILKQSETRLLSRHSCVAKLNEFDCVTEIFARTTVK